MNTKIYKYNVLIVENLRPMKEGHFFLERKSQRLVFLNPINYGEVEWAPDPAFG